MTMAMVYVLLVHLKHELINIQTQIHFNKFSSNIFFVFFKSNFWLLVCSVPSFMAKRFKSFSRLQSLSLFLSLSLSLIDFFSPVFSCFQMIFYENAHFSYTVKFIFRECASCDGYFDWKNKEWVLHMSYKQKAVRAHCIGHKNCWLTLNLLLLRLFITFLCVCVCVTENGAFFRISHFCFYVYIRSYHMQMWWMHHSDALKIIMRTECRRFMSLTRPRK